MSIKSIPEIETLIESILKQKVGEYFKSVQFKRLCIKIKIEDVWREYLNHVQENRGFYIIDQDYEYLDNIDAFVLLSNNLYEGKKEYFFNFIDHILSNFANLQDVRLDTSEIVEDLILINAPKEVIEKIKALDSNYSKLVPKAETPSHIWNATKLDDMLNNMDDAIKSRKYNLALTFAYTCLEGLYKSYWLKFIEEKTVGPNLPQIAKTVRNHLEKKLEDEEIKFPKQMLSLIPTITNAIADARNSFSDSHFDNDSEKWMAEFARDLVNSIGRLLFKYL